MSHNFATVPHANIQRSVFNLSHGHKTTFNSGDLIPIWCEEVLPGDTFNVHLTTFARLATQIVPVMDNAYLSTFFFFVPNRLLWNHWEQFNGAQNSPDDSTDFLVPTITTPSTGSGIVNGTLYDHFAIPTQVTNLTFNALPIRAYHLIYDQWFRDENLLDGFMTTSSQFGDGPDDFADNNVIHKRCKRHDYFTSCLPWPQKGPGVGISLSGDLAVVGDGKAIGVQFLGSSSASTMSYAGLIGGGTSSSDSRITKSAGAYDAAIATSPTISSWSVGSGVGLTQEEGKSGIVAKLSSATAITINSLRQAFQVQRWYECAARGGTRYTEILRAFFGVTSPDSRLQRAEFLGGTTTPIQIQTVTSTSSNSDQSGTPSTYQEDYLGGLAANGVISNRSGFVKSFVEHGYILCIIEASADLNYQQGLHKMWSRRTRFDFYWPTFAHLGEQAVLNKEIYAQGADVTDSSGNSVDDLPFGYQERYAEYRFRPNEITGQFRSNFSATLDYWHYAQHFTSLPTLGADFIVDNPPISRSCALNTAASSTMSSYPQFLFDGQFDIKAVRPMPTYGVPGLMDHF